MSKPPSVYPGPGPIPGTNTPVQYQGGVGPSYSSTIPIKTAQKDNSSATTWFCGYFCLTFFADQITTLMYAASICDDSYGYCINIVIRYAYAAVFISVFCAIYFYDSMHTFSDFLFSYRPYIL